MENKQFKMITILTIVCSIALAIVSWCGSFAAWTYERDAASMAAQGMGQDMVNLFLVVPMLIISLVFMHRQDKIAGFIFSGTVFYVLYSFFIYSFGVHFNNLFLLYCVVLGTSLYMFILCIVYLNGMDVENWFSEKIPSKSIGIFFITVAVMFYLLWLNDVVPAILNSTIPKTVSDLNLLVNPVHVLDMAIALPGLVMAAALLMKKRRLGYILTPIFLVFILVLTIALIAMVIMLKVKGISDNTSIAWIFAILSIISFAFLWMFFKSMKKK